MLSVSLLFGACTTVGEESVSETGVQALSSQQANAMLASRSEVALMTCPEFLFEEPLAMRVVGGAEPEMVPGHPIPANELGAIQALAGRSTMGKPRTTAMSVDLVLDPETHSNATSEKVYVLTCKTADPDVFTTGGIVPYTNHTCFAVPEIMGMVCAGDLPSTDA